MEYTFLNLPLLFITILYVFFILHIRKRGKTNASVKLPPGPMKLPIIGNLHNLVGSLPHHRLRELSLKYGPIIHLQLGEISAVVVSSPETAEAVMKTHDVIFAKRPNVPAADILTYGSKDIAFSHGKHWRQLRKLCTTELLSPSRVKSFRSIREEEVVNVINAISSSAGTPVNLTQMIYSLTYGITGKTAFGNKCKQIDEFVEIVQEGSKLSAGFGLADVFPSIQLFGTISGMRQKVEKLHNEGEMILNNIISEHMANRKNSQDNLLSVLLNLQERGDLEFPLTTDTIKAVIYDMFGAGGDTTSTTMEWAMAAMIKNPRVMQKAQEEVRKVFREKGTVDEAGLEELTFLKCVIKETLRIHNPVPLCVPRESQEHCKINGYDIPFKTKVLVNTWEIGRDPRYWTDPDTFIPERFLDSPVNYKGADFQFLPFGAGRRICPGMIFAQSNLELSLASFLYHFDWKLPGEVKNEDIDMTEVYGITVKKKQDLLLIATPYRT